jgi:hypothetical protein
MTRNKPRLREAAINGSKRLKKILGQFPAGILAQAEQEEEPFEFLFNHRQQEVMREARPELLSRGFSPETLEHADQSSTPLTVLREEIIASLPAKIQAIAKEKTDEEFGKFVMDYCDNFAAAASQAKADQMLFDKSTVLPPDFGKVTAASETNDLARMMRVADDFIFENLKFAEGRDLTDPWLQSRIKIACSYNDQRFFKRLGRALSNPPSKQPGIGHTDKLSRLLVARWMPVTTKTGRAPGLCWFTDESLTDVCRTILGNKSLTLDTVRKTRQRLGLKHAGRPWITHVVIVDGKIVFSSGRRCQRSQRKFKQSRVMRKSF